MSVRPALRWAARWALGGLCAVCAASLSGCALVSLGATVAETAVSAAGTAVSAAGTVVTTTGKVVGGAVDAATGSKSDKSDKSQ